MAQPSKSRNPEFLANRRKAIAELARRRRQKELLRAPGLSLKGGAKVAGRISLAIGPPPHS